MKRSGGYFEFSDLMSLLGLKSALQNSNSKKLSVVGVHFLSLQAGNGGKGTGWGLKFTE